MARWMRGGVWLATTLAAIVAMAAPVWAQEPQRGGALRVGLLGDFTTMDPHMSTSTEDRDLYYQLYSPLLALDGNLKITPELAESWEQPDAVTYVFRLRKGVKFHDGTDLTAEAVKWNFDRILNPATGSIRRSEVASIKAVDVLDPLRVKVTLKEPDATFLAALSDRAGMIVSPAAVEKHGKDFARHAVGTGPFQFVEWVKDDHLTIRRFPGYWKAGLPYLDEIVYKGIPDNTVKLTALRTGSLDLIDDLPPKDIAATKANPKLRVVETPGLGYRRIELNHTRPPFNNKALRQAVAWAINREAIHRAVFFGAGAPAQGPIAPNSWAYEALPGFGSASDLAKAKEKLAESGEPNGFRFTLMVVNNSVAQKQAEIIQENLKRAGITMEIALLEVGAFDEKRKALQFDAAEGRWSGRVDPDGNMFLHMVTGAGNNWGKYSNSRMDEILRAARTAGSQAERKRLYGEAMRLIIDDVPIIFLHHDAWSKGWDARVQGYVEIPDGRMRLERVWLGK